jgi:hypothetical protein
MDIKPIGPGNVGFGDVKDASSVNQAKPTFPSAPATPAQAAGQPQAAELEALAGLGKVEDLNDPEKSRAIVRNALSIVSESELSQLTPKERENLTEWMANDPAISGRTLKLMSKVLRGD